MKRRDFLRGAGAVTGSYLAGIRYVTAQSGVRDLPAVDLDGNAIVLHGGDVQALAAGFDGDLLLPDQRDYSVYRFLWNGMFDKRPALIARCANTVDVAGAVNFARENQLLTAIRCGGHSFSGKSTCDGGLMIDLTRMNQVDVDTAARTVRIDGGCLLHDMDQATQAHGLATTAGTVSHTGAGGLTLGGGYGRISRKYRLASDNLLGAEVVLADGRVLACSESDNPDLFWAIRGGGGNFGVVTAFTYRLHEVGPIVYGGSLAYAFEDAREVMNFYSDFAHGAPDEVFGGGGFGVGPDGRPTFGLSYNYCGEPSEGERLLTPLRRKFKVLADTCQATPYLALQTSGDARWPHGRRYYMKSGFIRKISADVIDEVVERYAGSPHPQVRTIFYQVGGAANRVDPAATAYWEREAEFDVMIFAGWDGPVTAQQDADNVAAVREHWAGMEPFVNGTYLNSEANPTLAKVQQNFGGNYERLVQVKTKYDPMNLFRMNSNIKPA